MHPMKGLDVDAYCDADFAGLYQREPDHLPVSVQSRAGWVITIGGCPALWRSALIAEIALSTTHAEYVALSQCMQVIIPLVSMMKEVLACISEDTVVSTTFHSTVFEDNMGAFYLANNQRLTSRSKHFLVKWHHFWEHVKTSRNTKGEIKVVKVDTKLQNADYLTKGLSQEVFQANRHRVQGWIAQSDQNYSQSVPNMDKEEGKHVLFAPLSDPQSERESQETVDAVALMSQSASVTKPVVNGSRSRANVAYDGSLNDRAPDHDNRREIMITVGSSVPSEHN